MKKIPLFFSLLLFSCAAPRQRITNNYDISKYKQPYHVFAIGQWNPEYIILTLIDANNSYLTIQTKYNASLKKGAVYTP
ncbi:hypothetical protein [Mucilaginibacter sp.]|uniref:hypothetical protein n=1 Tax=Mucilaginibacter sp. TaxID=1882438 RepID=UPI002606A63E|nr:hypothetical protein [Mucilaginibacter sp.]MDB4927125.1 hypothetical protein [Mucilaginibacter sp.]